MSGPGAEIVEQSLAALRQGALHLALALAALAALALVEGPLRRRARAALPALSFVGLLGCIGWGLWLSRKVWWLCDDAFITFRYAQNLAEGHGLVFNPGEWVEGYTNFLWAVALGALGKLGADIPHAALFGNLLAFATCLALVTATVRRASPSLSEGAVAPPLPFATLVLAGSSAFTTFATSGLETMPAAAWVCLGMAASTTRARPWVLGLVFVGAALTRPDHVLYGVAMGAALLAEDLRHGEGVLLRRLRPARLAAYAAPFFLVLVPYWLLRWRAYGDFYPNTYYAKSGGEAYWTQGGVYLVHFLATTGAWLGLPVMALAFLGRTQFRDDTRLRAFALGSCALVVPYVTKVGGDFMEHRFFITLLPVIAASTEVALRWRQVGARRAWTGVALAVPAVAAAALAITPVKIIGAWEKKWNLAAEETFYQVKSLFPVEMDTGLFHEARALAKAFPEGGPRPRYATGCVGMVGYYSGLPVVDTYGLANRRVAHKQISGRGRPGHEKWASTEDVWEERSEIANNLAWPEWAAETSASVPGHPFFLVRWTPELDAAIRKAGGRAPDVDADIARHAAAPDRGTAVRAWLFYQRFLENDPGREQRLDPLVRRLAAVADFEDGLPPGASVRGAFSVQRGGASPTGVTGDAWVASGGEGQVRLPLTHEDVARVRLTLGGAAGGRVGARLEGPVGQVLSTATLPLPGSDDSVWLEVPAVAPAPLEVVVFDEDARPGFDVWADGVHVITGADRRRAESLATLPPAQLLAGLRELGALLGDASPHLAAARNRVFAHWTFDDVGFPEGATVVGAAWGAPVAGALPRQSPVSGHHGARFLNSYHGGDEPTGRIELPLPTGQLTVSALVGGSADCARVYVGVEVDGRVLQRACGRQDEVLRPVLLEADVQDGAAARLVLVDDSQGGWGHLLADDILVARSERRPAP